MTGCENDIFLVIGPSTTRIVRSNPNIVSNLRKNQLWLYVQNIMNLTITKQMGNVDEQFLDVSLHDIDSFWENTNDEYYAQNKGNHIQCVENKTYMKNDFQINTSLYFFMYVHLLFILLRKEKFNNGRSV